MPDLGPANHIWLWQGFLLMASQSLTNRSHVHFPASLYVGLQDELTVHTNAAAVTGQLILVRANCEQRVDSHGLPLLDLLVDADGAAYRYLEPLLVERDAVAITYAGLEQALPRWRLALAGELCCQQAWSLVEELLVSVSAYRPQRPDFDARIEKVAQQLRAELPVNPDIELLAQQAGISASRFMHLFKQQYGLPVRQYLLWARLMSAVALWQRGLSFTDIAPEVGFYDQAHFTRTVRRMLDVAPSWLAKPGNVRLHHCGD